MRTEVEYQLSFDNYRLAKTRDMLKELGVPNPAQYRRRLNNMFAENTRVNGTAQERTFEWVKFKLELRKREDKKTT